MYLLYIFLLIFHLFCSNNKYAMELSSAHKKPRNDILDYFKRNDNFRAYRLLCGMKPEIETINVADQDGNTPLHYMVGRSSYSYLLDLLLSKGAYIEAKNALGQTPLLHAAEECDFFTMIYLIRRNANCEALNNKGRTLLHAIFANQILIEALNKRGSIFNDAIKKLLLLLTYKSCSLKKIILHEWALHYQEKLQAIPIKDLQIDLLCTAIKYSNSVLQECDHTSAFYKDFCKELILQETSTDSIINYQDKKGNTVLHYAVRNQAHPSFIKTLIEMGAGRLIENNAGKKPYQLFSKNYAENLCNGDSSMELYLLLYAPQKVLDFFPKTNQA